MSHPIRSAVKFIHLGRDESPRFTALSYTWGSGVKSESIVLNDALFKITLNLSLFFRQAISHAQDHRLGPFNPKPASSQVASRFRRKRVGREKGKCGWDGKWLQMDSLWICSYRTVMKPLKSVKFIPHICKVSNSPYLVSVLSFTGKSCHLQ